jgi:EAL domain-containing protein (putative c-di-GMP-specific phosphodiesterase class I)
MQNHQYRNSGMGLTAGIYIIENSQMDLEVAIENAMLAWKNAKGTGRRDIVVYDVAFRNRRAEEQRVIGEFFEALYRDDFKMYLQPKFKLGGDRTVYGAEALARWRRPDGEILTPYYFIDALEKIGYVTELDFYIYEQVLKTLDKWKRKDKRPIIISTNFSGRHFDGDGEEFLKRISNILSKYDVDPGCVEIEVTESVMVQSVEVLRHCMDRLHEMGFRVAIDDFGTGYSSLSVLGDIPADVIKIDKSFLDNHMSDQKLSLLYEIGRMVRIMKKDIIVEGVETEEQEKVLLEGGFTCAQGYLCNKPLPLTQFEDLYL